MSILQHRSSKGRNLTWYRAEGARQAGRSNTSQSLPHVFFCVRLQHPGLQHAAPGVTRGCNALKSIYSQHGWFKFILLIIVDLSPSQERRGSRSGGKILFRIEGGSWGQKQFGRSLVVLLVLLLLPQIYSIFQCQMQMYFFVFLRGIWGRDDGQNGKKERIGQSPASREASDFEGRGEFILNSAT